MTNGRIGGPASPRTDCAAHKRFAECGAQTFVTQRNTLDTWGRSSFGDAKFLKYAIGEGGVVALDSIFIGASPR
jgi:hypothetical protein